jgi:phosphatidylglycerophosphate synthase
VVQVSAALAAGVALVAGGVLLRPTDRLGRVLLSFADRLFDACVLGALAWVTRAVDTAVAAGALVALAAGFLASYIRARGGSLGYGIEEGIVTPALRYGLVGLGLVAGWRWAVWVVAVLMVLACGVRASQVFKEERC